jgi:transposase-like protein
MTSVLNEPYFSDETAAFERLEQIVWPNGPVCPFCGNVGRMYSLNGVRTKPSKKHPEGIIRHGLRKCGECRKQFTVRRGTIFEDSPIPLHVWFQAAYLLCASKKGISANQLHRTLGVTLQTAWFMGHRLREAMRAGDLAPLGGTGGAIEIDETAIGRVEGAPKKGPALKGRSAFRNTVLTLVERGGSARSFHIDSATIATMKPIIKANVACEAAIMTDEFAAYREIGADFASHDTVKHSDEEYVRREGDKVVTTTTVAGFYSIFKRGMKGGYQRCRERHLPRYLAEFDFRYSNRAKRGVDDAERTALALRGIAGKRLMYRDSLGATA